MPSPVYVFDAELVGFRGVRRRLAVRSEQTLVDLHHALQDAFGWDDDHLYSFWLKGEFWGRDGSEYTHPFHAAQPSPLGPFATGPAPRTAKTKLNRLRLRKGQRIAYLFDFGDEWRVQVVLREIETDDGGRYPRIVEGVGEAPPQYPQYDEGADAA